MNHLGYFQNYGGLIIAFIILTYASFYAYLCNEYQPIDEDKDPLS